LRRGRIARSGIPLMRAEGPLPPSRERPKTSRQIWTQVGAVSAGAHVFYELLSGVAMPFASVIGPVPAATGWGMSTAVVLRMAERADKRHEAVLGVVNGLFLTTVLAHFIHWPKRWRFGVPSLSECEGLCGPILVPYNGILYISGLSAVAGLLENGRRGAVRVAIVPLLGVPVLLRLQRMEFRRLRLQARRNPRWWNRRLQMQPPDRSTSSDPDQQVLGAES